MLSLHHVPLAYGLEHLSSAYQCHTSTVLLHKHVMEVSIAFLKRFMLFYVCVQMLCLHLFLCTAYMLNCPQRPEEEWIL